MANYYAQTVIQQTIPEADMTPLERLLLSRIFQSEPIGDGWYLFAEENPCTMIAVNRKEIEATIAETTDTGSAAYIYITEQLAALACAGEDIDFDLSGTSWEFFLQDIVKRSKTLDHVSVVTAFTCSKMRPDGFGGMAMLITADAVVGKSTNDILEDTLAQARETFADHPDLPWLIAEGCIHVERKWESYNDDLHEARSWAIELAQHYAAEDGIALVRRVDGGNAS